MTRDQTRLSAAGILLEVSIVDTQSDTEKAKNLLHEQYQDGALIVIGGATSEEAKAMIPVAENDDRYLLSPSASSPELTGASTRFYRIFPSDSAAATMMAQFASLGLNATKVVVITEQQSYARGIHGVFQPAFEGYGGEVIEVIEVPPGRADLKGLMDGVFTFEPDTYAAHGYDAMKVVASALGGRPPLPGEVVKGLRDFKDFAGVTGSINFDEKGDVQKYPRLYIIGDDLALYDYNERVGKQKEERDRQREELRRKLEQIAKQAEGISG